MKATTYREFCDSTGKLKASGSLRPDNMDSAAQDLAARYGVKVLNSGRTTFVDSKGNPVSIYLRIDPSQTPKGEAAIAEDATERRARAEAERRTEARLEVKRQELLDLVGDDLDAAIETVKKKKATT